MNQNSDAKQLDGIFIKGNAHGLTVHFDDQQSIEDLLIQLGEKLESSRKFFGENTVTLTLNGRSFSHEMELKIVDIIQKHSDLSVSIIVDSSKPSKVIDLNPTKKSLLAVKPNPEVIFDPTLATLKRGTLRSGQVITSEHSILFIGNVHAGASIIAKGHIIILGSLLGSVHAGSDGFDGAFVMASNMRPTQVRIGGYLGCSPDTIEEKQMTQIAFVDKQNIYMEDFKDSLFDELNLLKLL